MKIDGPLLSSGTIMNHEHRSIIYLSLILPRLMSIKDCLSSVLQNYIILLCKCVLFMIIISRRGYLCLGKVYYGRFALTLGGN